MSTDTSASPPNTGGETPSGPTPAAGDGFEPITSQDQLNRVLAKRLERERERFSDYDDLKAQVAKVPEWEAKVTEAEAKVAEIPTQVTAALRTHLVEVHKIDKDDADLFLTATEPETLLKQVQRLVSRSTTNGPHVPREGATSTAKDSEERAFVRNLFGGGS